jgi:hypothetical protein
MIVHPYYVTKLPLSKFDSLLKLFSSSEIISNRNTLLAQTLCTSKILSMLIITIITTTITVLCFCLLRHQHCHHRIIWHQFFSVIPYSVHISWSTLKVQTIA